MKTQLNDKVYVIFVDLFMLLLATYVLHGDFTKYTYGQMTLSSTSSVAGSPPEEKAIMLKVFAGGNVQLDKQSVALPELEKEVKERSGKQVIVAVDQKASWQYLGPVLLGLYKTGKELYFVYEKTE